MGQTGKRRAKRPDLLGLGEEALPHFSATSSDQNRAIWVESNQGRFRPHHGPLESAQGQRKGMKGSAYGLTCLTLVNRPCPISVPAHVTRTVPSGQRLMRAGRGPVAPCSKALNLCRFHARLVILCMEFVEHHAELTCGKAWNLCSFHM